MSEKAVANTGPLVHLTEIGQESQLTIFEWVSLSDSVKVELMKQGAFVLQPIETSPV